MMKQFTNLLWAIVLVFFAGCSATYYVPNTQNVPLMKEKNEFKAVMSVDNFQMSYAATDNLGIAINGFVNNFDYGYFKSSSNLRDEDYVANRMLLEGGLGYFNVMEDILIFETYVGGGYGFTDYRVFDDTDAELRRFNSNTTKLYLQPAIGLSTDNIDVAFSLRFSGLKYALTDTLNYSLSMQDDDDILYLDQGMKTFLEPAITFRAGYKFIKFQAQACYSNYFGLDPLNYQNFTYNIGIVVDIAPRYKTPSKASGTSSSTEIKEHESESVH